MSYRNENYLLEPKYNIIMHDQLQGKKISCKKYANLKLLFLIF